MQRVVVARAVGVGRSRATLRRRGRCRRASGDVGVLSNAFLFWHDVRGVRVSRASLNGRVWRRFAVLCVRLGLADAILMKWRAAAAPRELVPSRGRPW